MDRFHTQPSNWRELWGTMGNLWRALSRVLRPSNDVLVDDSARGFVIKDRTNGNYYRIYVDAGVLHTEVEANP